MGKNVMAVISAIIFISLFVLAVRAWRSRILSQQSSFSEPLEALEYFGQLLISAKAFYVATTYAENVLERIAAYGLGARGNAQVFVFTEGLLVVRDGERSLAIDKANILSVDFGQVAIDKVVETDGLVQITWLQEETKLITHLRVKEIELRNKIYSEISGIITKEESR
jgi:hypothetical protein